MDGFVRWLASTPNRTFVLYPLCVIAFELALIKPDEVLRHYTEHGLAICAGKFADWKNLTCEACGSGVHSIAASKCSGRLSGSCCRGWPAK